MSNIKHIIPLGPTIIGNKPGGDGYTLTIINDESGPAIYIDKSAGDAYGALDWMIRFFRFFVF